MPITYLEDAPASKSKITYLDDESSPVTATGGPAPSMGNLVGIGEVGLQAVTGGAGLAASALSNIVGGIQGKSAKEIAQSGGELAEKLTYKPRTLEGQGMSEGLALPFKGWQMMGEKATDALDEAGASRGVSAGAGAATAMVPQVIAALLGQRANSGNAGKPFPTRSVPTPDPKPIPLIDSLLPGGTKRAAARMEREIAGTAADRDALVAALQGRREMVPGSKPTTAEVVADMPQGIAIAALEQHLRKQTGNKAGNPATRFDERAQAQQAARDSMAAARDEVTAPMREDAMRGANASGTVWEAAPDAPTGTALKAPGRDVGKPGGSPAETGATINMAERKIPGGVPVRSIVAHIDSVASKPGIRSSEVASKAFAEIRAKVERFTDERGNINARDLYTIRKEMGNVIERLSSENKSWDKRLTGGLQSSLQKTMDTAIESAGGKGWKDYLDTYAATSQAIEADAALAPAAAARGKMAGIDQSNPVGQIPNALNAKVTVINALLNRMGKKASPKVIDQMTRDMLDPDAFAAQIRTLPPTQQKAIVAELMKRYGAGAGASLVINGEGQ